MLENVAFATRTNWLLAAGRAPPARAAECGGLGVAAFWRTGWLWRPRRSAPRRSVGRASAGRSPIRRRRRRSRSAPAPAPGVRTRTALRAGCPGTIHAHDPRRGRRRGGPRLRLRHRGALRRADARGDAEVVWVTLPSESKEAYAKLTAGLTPRPARTLPSVGEDALPVAASTRSRGPERGHPGAGERRLERLDRRAGRRGASGAHGGVAAQDPPPPRVDAASGARGTGVGTVRSAQDVPTVPANREHGRGTMFGGARVGGPTAAPRSPPQQPEAAPTLSALGVILSPG